MPSLSLFGCGEGVFGPSKITAMELESGLRSGQSVVVAVLAHRDLGGGFPRYAKNFGRLFAIEARVESVGHEVATFRAFGFPARQ